MTGGSWAGSPTAAASTSPPIPRISRSRAAYTAAVNQYVREELGYENDLPYEILSSATNQAWSYKEFEGRSVSVVDRLGETMRANPHLRIQVACGYYDGATPYFAAQAVFAHLPIPEELRANVSFSYFEAGHMMYVHEPSRIRQSADLAAFVTAGRED